MLGGRTEGHVAREQRARVASLAPGESVSNEALGAVEEHVREHTARERFARIAGCAPDAGMSYEAFIADLVQRDLEPDEANELYACVNPHQYRIPNARAYCPPEGYGVSANGYAFIVASLARARADGRCAAVELHAVGNRFAQRSVRDCLRALAACEGHVEWLSHAILGMDSDATAAARLPAALLLEGPPLARMRALGIDPSTSLRQPPSKRRRTVLDGRAAVARTCAMSAPSTAECASRAECAHSELSACSSLERGLGRLREGATVLPVPLGEQQLQLQHAYASFETPQIGLGCGSTRGSRECCGMESDGAFVHSPSALCPSHAPPPLTRVVSERVCAEQMGRGLLVHPELLTASRWRGPLAPARGSQPFELAHAVLSKAHGLAAELSSGRTTVLSTPGAPSLLVARLAAATHCGPFAQVASSASIRHDYSPPSSMRATRPSRALLWLLGATDAASACAAISQLSGACAAVLAAQPAVVRVRAPAKVLGDVHGHLSELLLLLHAHGFPTSRGPGGDVEICSYVFNGAFLDRGPHQLETAVLLLALKVAYPSRVFLLRGSHEIRAVNRATDQSAALGFGQACRVALGDTRLGDGAFEHVHAALDWLPAGAIIGGSIAVVHGGLGDGSWTLADLEAHAEAARPLGEGRALPPVLAQALWSDPLEDGAGSQSGSKELGGADGCPDAPARPAESRGVPFGCEVSSAWCEREDMGLVIRAHQCVPGGFRVAHGGRLITVFSARDYARADGSSGAGNSAALLLVAEDDEGCLRVRAKVLASSAASAAAEHAPS